MYLIVIAELWNGRKYLMYGKQPQNQHLHSNYISATCSHCTYANLNKMVSFCDPPC